MAASQSSPEPAIQLLIGTTKGAFVLDGDAAREHWNVRGPFCDGAPINHVVGDAATGTLWAGGGGDWTGAGVWRSTDAGHTWTQTKLTTGALDEWAANDPGFAASIGWVDVPAPFGKDFTQVWSLGRVADKLYAGTKPATLLVSEDDGQTWDVVRGLSEHPSAAEWNPGAAGLVLHTIIADPVAPESMWIGISAAGVFATTDGGTTWQRRNKLADESLSGAEPHPAGPENGDVGHCVHNIVVTGDRLYQQNHQGVWRSDDRGEHWHDIANGLPSRFGFPIRVHPRDADMIWTLPLNGDMEGRFPPDAAAAVWRSTDAGKSWQAQRTGLPQQACFFTVLRQAMAVDDAESVGVYFGTNTGSVFASLDEGETWLEIARHLPTVLSVEVLCRVG